MAFLLRKSIKKLSWTPFRGATAVIRGISSTNTPIGGGAGDPSDAKSVSDVSSSLAYSSLASYNVSGGSSYMRGVMFTEPSQPLRIEEFHMPRPKANEVLVKTKACGVCHSDLHVIKGELPFPSPCVIGHEITGEVVEHGPDTDRKITQRLPIGSHVVGAFIMPCGSCSFCSKGQDDLCEDFFAYNRAKGTLYDGETRLFLRSNEYCVVPAHGLAALPGSLPYSESAILGCAVFTAYGAMTHAAEVRGGDTVAVIGIGGVGSSCLQIARAFGASIVVAVDISDEKLQKAKLVGATHTVNALQEDVVEKIKEITGGVGVDIAVEALGKPRTFLQCTQSVRDGGKAVMIGLADSSARGEVDINRLVRRQVKIIGSYGARARQDLPKLIKLAETGTFNLTAAVSRKYDFEDAGKAYEDLNKGSIIGRAVVNVA
ncbi:Succinate-semialdehyde dehydrogenase (acetylating)-like protein [Drosera capensis]